MMQYLFGPPAGAMTEKIEEPKRCETRVEVKLIFKIISFNLFLSNTFKKMLSSFYCLTIKTFIAMQKNFTRGVSMLFMMLFLSTALLSQEETTPTQEKIIITIKGTDAKGAKITRSMMKTGEDAKILM